jgi:hypothetical protein
MAGFLMVMAILACGKPAEEWQLRGWTVTPSPFLPTQTPFIVVHTTTPVYTYTPIVKEVTSTPKPVYLCVVADVAVHLRPSPSIDNYPITPLSNGTKLMDLGGKREEWIFVQYGELSGWVRSEYTKSCK